MQAKNRGRKKMMAGVFTFAWAELKTMNVVKIKSLYKILVGYLSMKYFGPKKIERPKKSIEASYRVTH